MATRRREAVVGSWWWGGAGEEGGEAGGGEFTFGEMSEIEVVALGGYELQEVEMAEADPQEEVDSDIFQLSYPRPRLRWTTELHDQFVKAVDELGGANKATPKGILNLMGVQGITLYHLKSHLQKFRLGKMGRKLWRKDFVPANYYRQRGARVPPMNVQAQGRPSLSNVFDNMNGFEGPSQLPQNKSDPTSPSIYLNVLLNEYRINTMGAETYGNLHLLVEKPQAAMENLEFPAKFAGLNANQLVGSSSTSAVKMEQEFAAAKPALLPLFPPIPACGMNYCPDWSEFLQVGGRRSVAPPPRPVEIASVDDYLNSLGYASCEFALTQSHDYSCSASMIFGSFFDEVASFSKVDGIDYLTSDGNVVPMEAHEHYYYP